MSVSYNLIVNECPHCKSSTKIHLFSVNSDGLFLLEGRNENNRDWDLHTLLSQAYPDFYSQNKYPKYTQIHNISDMFNMISRLTAVYPQTYIQDENGDTISIEQVRDLVKQSKKTKVLKWIEARKKDGTKWYEYKSVNNYVVWYVSFS